ncbi:short chain dehydrogenase family protein, partial [Vibrio parahaemolyticus V-223/04]
VTYCSSRTTNDCGTNSIWHRAPPSSHLETDQNEGDKPDKNARAKIGFERDSLAITNHHLVNRWSRSCVALVALQSRQHSG